jgi:sulfoxide reductase catalytic subunit YedY
LNRRQFLGAAGVLVAGTMAAETMVTAQQQAPHGRKLDPVQKSSFSTTEKPNTWQQITTYNNFYEFGVDKADAATYGKALKPSPWSIAMEGEVSKPGIWALEDVLKGMTLEERIYRHRCVEGWSMVIPWVGFPLRDLLTRLQPTSRARFVEFTTLNEPNQMPGLRNPYLRWPYTEGLRLDEAMHPLAILAVGLYGEVLPNQDGAPIRLVVPWKYGFKSIKSIVKIRLVSEQPVGSWQRAAPQEYGFYANVNPTVDHPRWSQAREVRLPGVFRNRPTEMFNGYGAQVVSLYADLDLRRNF